MKKTILILLLALIGLSTAMAQVGIGTTTPDQSAELDVDVSNLPANAKKGFLPPRMTTSERNDIASPAEGLTIYNTTVNCLQWYNSTGWFNACDGTTDLPPISSGPCAGLPVEITFNGKIYKPVASAGQCWLDRNLGANQVSTSLTDNASYGDLYQWGRSADGHQSIFRVTGDNPTSGTYSSTRPVNATDTGAWDGLFISGNFNNWLSTNPTNLWQGGNGINNPCPSGFRIPTPNEFDTQASSWSSISPTGAFNSPLKFSLAGLRFPPNGNLISDGAAGFYWTTITSTPLTQALYYQIFDDGSGTGTEILPYDKAGGLSVRCIKN